MRRIVLISFTSLEAGGGVPRWNRDFVKCFPGTIHFSFDDFLRNIGHVSVPEWDAARLLGLWLHSEKKITRDDLIVADGFWGDYLGEIGYEVISVAHGIWSHLTDEDVKAGKKPEFPLHHFHQVKHRTGHLKRGGKIVAVSDFISEQMNVQWGFDSFVINNAIDLEKFRPPTSAEWFEVASEDTRDATIIHGVTTANKGFDHIEAVKNSVKNADVLLLDEAEKLWNKPKYDCLRLADLVVQPSAYEGNSYFVLETLASGVPIVAYKVGLLHSIEKIAKNNGIEACIGGLIDRKYRSPEETAKVAKFILMSVMRDRSSYNPREVAQLFSIEKFKMEWQSFLESNGYISQS